eukprot:10758859-Alexandrium_andersonii.AAC.1
MMPSCANSSSNANADRWRLMLPTVVVSAGVALGAGVKVDAGAIGDAGTHSAFSCFKRCSTQT